MKPHKRVFSIFSTVAVFIVIFIAVEQVQKVFAAGPKHVTGTASGTLSIDGKGIKLHYAYAMAQPNTFDKKKTDIAVLLTEKPLPDGALDNLEELLEATRKQKGWAYFEIDENRKPIMEMIEHPSLGENRLQMSGFTHANFNAKVFGKDRIEGSFETNKVEDFLDHKYQIKVNFSSPIVQAKLPEPLPDVKTGKKLPAQGGEPGKAYMVLHDAIIKKDIATIRKLAPEGDEQMSEKELREGLEFMALMTPKKIKITKGYFKGDRAVLYITGKMDGENAYGTVEMVKKDGNWRLLKESWSNTPPEE